MKTEAVYLCKTLRIDRFDRDDIFGTLHWSDNELSWVVRGPTSAP